MPTLLIMPPVLGLNSFHILVIISSNNNRSLDPSLVE